MPDLAGKLPGRGAWATADRDLICKAITGNAFSRAFRAQTRMPTDPAAFVDDLAGFSRKRCLNKLGLLRRAGHLTTGFEKSREVLKKGRAGAYIEASDGAADGRGKLASVIRAACPGLETVAWFAREDLGAALGLDDAVHVIIHQGQAAGFLYEANRYAGLAGLGVACRGKEQEKTG